MKPIIEVENLSKLYRIGSTQRYLSLRDSVSSFGKKLLGHNVQIDQEKRTFWALQDINFKIEAGESVGIIGRNGAGKSTLLKILSRITPPTKGQAILRGRLASLLEVGTGFHTELTGRENVYMNGSILGLQRSEINRKFDEIVSFSGVERFIDTPLKHYSSGMQLRLAFAVAAHLEPDILIIDEVLAVGDAEFQKKCLGKMNDVSQSGRTIIFVSHDINMIKKLCKRSIILDKGQVTFDGSSEKGLYQYLEMQASTLPYYEQQITDKPIINSIKIHTSHPNQVHSSGQSLKIFFKFYTPRPIYKACFSFQIVDSLDNSIIHAWAFDSEKQRFLNESGIQDVCFIFPNLRLYFGSYRLNCFLTEPPGGAVFDTLKGVCPFKVEMYDYITDYPFPILEGNA